MYIISSPQIQSNILQSSDKVFMKVSIWVSSVKCAVFCPDVSTLIRRATEKALWKVQIFYYCVTKGLNRSKKGNIMNNHIFLWFLERMARISRSPVYSRVLPNPEVWNFMDLLQCIWERKDRERERETETKKVENKIKCFCIANQPKS